MSIPQWFAGQIMTADDMNARHPRMVQQENDQIVTSSTTVINSEITFTPEPNATYMYWLWISYSATINNGLRWSWLANGATFASFTQSISSPGASGTANTPQSVNMRRPGNTTGRLAGGSDAASPPVNFHSAYDVGTFTTDGTINSVTMQFAQAVSHANQTILRGGNQTRMIYIRIS
ncbi:hypothetical protein [Streptomyces ipomoeae]|uniref:hypothetical protein n=1 Tax=Streptomyces ipomoeae TaxID=103232 RepID=UPI0029B9E749|nr:hypothetical protein [Streptomyces ipomoeae]MDX2692966.1 hypothetical protein [Streptomyces ipomoeae]MDX2840698.1 hypothetical protein [Streptomyces ipomoeae]